MPPINYQQTLDYLYSFIDYENLNLDRNANNYDFFYANGHGGQFIFIVPDIDLVAVATTNWSGLSDPQAGTLWYNLINIIVNEVLVSFYF